MIRIDICYAPCCIETQTVSPTLSGLQFIKRCVQYLSSHLKKTYFILLMIMMDQISQDLYGVGIKLKTTQHIIF